MTALLRRTRADREAAEAALAPSATRSTASRGRARPEPDDPLRTCFERDRDRILHSKAFRRLKHKTQVFIDPEGDHYVTRLTHALQVTQVARALAAGLGLNEPLTEAIALGHDVGHSPFGHTGEEAPEAHVVRFADRIAYLSHDALDAVRAGLLSPADFPATVKSRLGPPGSRWIGEMVHAIVDHAPSVGAVVMEPAMLAVMHELRAFMFERVYGHDDVERRAAITIIRRLVDHFLARPDQLPDGYRELAADTLTQVVDHVTGMTDRYAVAAHDRLFGSPGRPVREGRSPDLRTG